MRIPKTVLCTSTARRCVALHLPTPDPRCDIDCTVPACRRQVRISQYPPSSPSGVHLPGSFPLGHGAADTTPVPQTSSLRQLGGMLAAAGASVGRSLASAGPGTGGAGSSGFGADYGGLSFSWGAMYSGSAAGRQSVDTSGGRRGLASAEKVEGRGAVGWLQGSAANTPGSLW